MIKTCSNGLPLYNMYSSLMITKSPTFTTLVSIVLCITHVLILVLLILWLYITFVITPSKPLDYPVTLSINNTLRWGVALVNPVDVTISSFTYFILPNINDDLILKAIHSCIDRYLRDQNRRVVVNLSLILLAPRPQPMKIRWKHIISTGKGLTRRVGLRTS